MVGAPARGLRRRPAGLSSTAASYGSCLDRLEAETRASLAEQLPAVLDAATRYEANLARLVHHVRLAEHASHPEIGVPETGTAVEAAGVSLDSVATGVTPADRDALIAFRQTWYSAVGIQAARAQSQQFAAYVQRLKDRRLAQPTAPSKTDRAAMIEEAARKMRPRGDIAAVL
jgi:hypothetical protein